MTVDAVAVILPVGDFETNLTRQAFNSIIEAVKASEWRVEIGAAVKDGTSAAQAVLDLSRQEPSLLIIVPLQGLSASIIESAASVACVPVLLCPTRGRFALPSSALAAGALRDAHRIVELLYGDADSAEFKARLRSIMRAARAYVQLRNSRIGIIGGVFPNLISCRYDPKLIQARFGISTLAVSWDRLRSLVAILAKQTEKIGQARGLITSAFDAHGPQNAALDSGTALHLALKELARTERIQAFATECWSAFPKEVGVNPCLGFVEDDYTLACEGDVLLCITLLAVRYLTGRSAYAGDLYDLDSEGLLTLVHCGGPASLAAEKSQVILGASKLASERGFETITCRPRLQAGPVTALRLYGLGGDQLHLAPAELIASQTSPNLEATLKLTGDRWDFLEQCFGNHYVVARGDIRTELRLLCIWLGITVHET